MYCDPPYHPTNESSFISYTKNGFTEKDQERLRDWLLSVAKKGVNIMVSNSKTEFIEKIYQDKHFKRYVVHAPRSVNCKPTKRNDVQEFLITSL